MAAPTDSIEDLAYCELLICCQTTGCMEIFEPTLDEPATDPVEAWAADMARRARPAGWTVDAEGLVRCPAHRVG